MPEGSWKCEKCNNINYPFRTKCNRQNCGADKPAESEKSPSSSPDQNEQVCFVKIFQFANIISWLQQLLVFHEQLCYIVNIFKWKAVVKLLFKWVVSKSFAYASCHLDSFVATYIYIYTYLITFVSIHFHCNI